MKDIDINRLAHLYYVEKKSISEIAKIFGCSDRTILNRMQENGMKRRSYSEAHSIRHAQKHEGIDISEIIYLYFEKELSLEAIAKQLGVSYTTIRERLIKAGYACRKIKGPSSKFTDAEVAEMAQLYHDKELTPAEIGDQYNCPASTINSCLKRFPGFRFRTRKEARALRKKKEELAVSRQQSAVSKEQNFADSHFYTPPKKLGKVFEPIRLLSPEQVTPERILQLRKEDELTLDDIAVVCSLSE